MGASVLWNFCEAVVLFAVADGDDDLIAVREPCWFRKMADFPVLFLCRCNVELLFVWRFSASTVPNDNTVSPGWGDGGGGSDAVAVPLVDIEFAVARAAALTESVVVPSVFFNSLLASCCFDNNNNVDGLAFALAIPFSFVSCE